MTGQLRLATSETEEVRQQPERSYSWIWLVVLVVMMAVNMAVGHADRAAVRRELDENAALIKQLQERRIVDELVGIKRKSG